MVADASDVDTSTSYTTSSSSEEEDGGRHKEKKHGNRNFNGLSCVATGYCTMAHNADAKKDDSDSDSECEVDDNSISLRREITRLEELVDNRDDVLRKTNKEMREFRSLLGESKEKVIELESFLGESRANVAELELLLAEARAEVAVLKAAPVVSDEVECVACDANLAELVELKEKYMVRVEEADVLRTQLEEFTSRPSLLGACTSCPSLHAKLNDALDRATSLETALKSPIANTCSGCDVIALKNVELEHYVNHLQDENDNLRKCLGWLSAHEPQLGMLIAQFRHADGQGLGSDKVGESSCEKRDESAECVPEPAKKAPTKNTWQPKPNHLCSKLDTTPDPPKFPQRQRTSRGE